MIFGTALACCVVLLVLAALIGLASILGSRDDASRAVVNDLVYFSVVAILAVFGVLLDSAVVEVSIMISALLVVLGTVSLSRIITRGRR